jgi:hypothetical protein
MAGKAILSNSNGTTEMKMESSLEVYRDKDNFSVCFLAENK